VRFVVDGPSSSGRLSEFLSYAPIFHLKIPVASPPPKPPVAIKKDNPVNEVIITEPAQQVYSQPKHAPQVDRGVQQRTAELLKRRQKGAYLMRRKPLLGYSLVVALQQLLQLKVVNQLLLHFRHQMLQKLRPSFYRMLRLKAQPQILKANKKVGAWFFLLPGSMIFAKAVKCIPTMAIPLLIYSKVKSSSD